MAWQEERGGTDRPPEGADEGVWMDADTDVAADGALIELLLQDYCDQRGS